MYPVVRQLLVCEDVRARPGSPNKVDVLGLMSAAGVSRGAFPIRLMLTVYTVLTSGRGTGEARIVVPAADTDEEVYQSPAYSISFPPDPLRSRGVTFRVSACPFPEPGLYFVELRYNGVALAQVPFEVRELP